MVNFQLDRERSFINVQKIQFVYNGSDAGKNTENIQQIGVGWQSCQLLKEWKTWRNNK